jgi:hypothetical protein
MASACLEGHVAPDIECLDRLYLNAYVPNLQVGGQVIRSCATTSAVRCAPPPSSSRSASASAPRCGPSPRRTGCRWCTSRNAIGTSTSYTRTSIGPRAPASSPSAWPRSSSGCSPGTSAPPTRRGAVNYGFDKAERRVKFYFYLIDAQFGAGFIKICSYLPYPMKVWANGHDWAKRQATRSGIAFNRARQRLRRR